MDLCNAPVPLVSSPKIECNGSLIYTQLQCPELLRTTYNVHLPDTGSVIQFMVFFYVFECFIKKTHL